MLATQEKSAGSLKAFSKNLQVISQGLETADAPLRDLLESTPAVIGRKLLAMGLTPQQADDVFFCTRDDMASRLLDRDLKPEGEHQ